MSWRRSIAATLAGAAWLALPAIAQDDPAGPGKPTPPRTGTYHTAFPEGHPLAAIAEQRKRFGWSSALVEREDPAKGVVDWSAERFVVAVPETYTADVAHGLLVYVSATDEAQIHPDWLPVLARRRCIAVSFAKAGNQRLVWYRIALALAAVHNVRARYTIDPKRVYLGGYSGGGILSCRAAMHYPEVFTGVFPMCGAGYFRDVPAVDDRRKVWKARFNKPSGTRWSRARRELRWVFFTGSADMNQPNIKARVELGYKRDGFKHLHYLEKPGHGHVWPDAEWFGKGLTWLDAEDR